VFEPGYRLRSLKEVKGFIETNGHLPEIPSATEVAEQGLDMAAMQMRLLRKVEELTLYTMQQQEFIEQQRESYADLKGTFEQQRKTLEERLAALDVAAR
jgi:hypothetical protein